MPWTKPLHYSYNVAPLPIWISVYFGAAICQIWCFYDNLNDSPKIFIKSVELIRTLWPKHDLAAILSAILNLNNLHDQK